MRFAAVDKAGVLTTAIADSTTHPEALSSGTFAESWSILDGANSISIQCDANTSLAGATLVIRFEVSLFGADATITVP